jgi:homoserine dehydrogenase
MATESLRILVSGLGGVGRAFVRLIQDKRGQLADQYGLDLQIAAVVTSDGAAVATHDALPDDVLTSLAGSTRPASISTYGQPGTTTLDLIQRGLADLLIETTPTNIQTGEPGLTHLREALRRGMHVVSATKGPLVLAYPELRQLAIKYSAALKFSSATAAALPAFDLGYYCLAGTSILKVEGILNGTTNFILTRMQQEGESYADALSEAQRRGIAEPNPTLDVEGWDSANKLVIIVNGLLNGNLTLSDVSVSGITQVSAQDLQRAKAAGSVLKLIAAAEVTDGRIAASVQVRELPLNHPLAGVNGSEKGITYTTDTMDKLTVVGGKSDPRAAAAAMLKDIINITREFPLERAQEGKAQ